MHITFLGTSSGVPTKNRNVSSVALRFPQRKEFWLFDCGEGTQHQVLRSSLSISRVTRLFITHMHGDHTLGLPGLLASAGLAGNVGKIDIHGPPELREFLKNAERLTYSNWPYPVDFHVVEEGKVFEDGEYVVECAPLKHRVPAFGYSVREKDRAGRFRVEQAQTLGIPPGPVFGRLKRGEVVTLPDGRVIDGAALCDPPKKGRKFVYCTDTMYTANAVKLAQDADVLVHECTYAARDEDLAIRAKHSTAEMAARVALEAGVGKLFITHFSPRYSIENDITPDDLLDEARRIFPETDMARDFLTFEIPSPNEYGGSPTVGEENAVPKSGVPQP